MACEVESAVESLLAVSTQSRHRLPEIMLEELVMSRAWSALTPNLMVATALTSNLIVEFTLRCRLFNHYLWKPVSQ